MKIFNQEIVFYGVSRRIILGFASIILFFAVSMFFVRKIVSNSKDTLNQLFEEKDKSVEQINELRRIIILTKLNIVNTVYLPKDEQSQQTLQQLHDVEFPRLKTELLKSIAKWDHHLEKNRTLLDLKLYEQNIKYQHELLKLLPDFESHNNPAAMFQSEDLLEMAILPSLDKIIADVEVTLKWKKSEKEEARQSMNEAYDLMIKVLLFIGFVMTILGLVATQVTANQIAKPLKRMKDTISRLSEGELVSGEIVKTHDEIEEISLSIKKLVESMKYNARYAESIGEGQFDMNYTPLSEKDELGYSLKLMNEKLKELIDSLQTTQQQTLLAKTKAEEALVAKSQFLSVMSHEIRTPLNAILGMSNLLNDAELSDEQQDYLATIQFSAKSLYHLINEILDITKLDAGKVQLEKVEFDLKNQVSNIKKLHEPNALVKHLKINFETNLSDQVRYKGDSFRLNQVLNNFISNAIKFTDEGEINVLVNVIRGNDEYDWVEFKVKDTGIGIAKSKFDLVFESFAQADLNTTRLYGGTGLGLSICKKLIEMMGSDIELESELGKGSCFSFILKLPKVSQTAINFPAENAPIGTSLIGKKILVVEDNSINAKVMAAFLKKWGMQYEIAENGQVALNKVIENEYDLILMDLQMPVMDGYEATKRIKPIKPTLPIVALSAEAFQDIKSLIEEFGFDNFVTKPFEPHDLISKMEYYTSEHFQAKVTNTNQNHLVSFYRYNELSNNDTAFFEMVIKQVLDDFVDLKKLISLENEQLFANKTIVEACFNKLSPSIKMLALNDLHNQLFSFINFNSIEDIDKSTAKLTILQTMQRVIDEIEQKINSNKIAEP